MYLRYSSRVVAPIHRNSPRAIIGLSKFPASIAPWLAPAPTTVWISSINRIIWPWDSVTSLRTALSLSSNSPRYFAPAIRAPISREINCRSFKDCGTSPLIIRWARPSAIAVLPTPGSPISTGLFLVRRDKIWIVRRISSSRPITGSSLPRRAKSVRSRPYLERDSYLPSGLRSFTVWLPLICETMVFRLLSANLNSAKNCLPKRSSWG